MKKYYQLVDNKIFYTNVLSRARHGGTEILHTEEVIIIATHRPFYSAATLPLPQSLKVLATVLLPLTIFLLVPLKEM